MQLNNISVLRRNYHPEIDGLRAIAVLAVVIFHTFPNWFPGGFIGVDVFFVISGFLISKIIFENLEMGEFSFSDFYASRIKRIFPALITILIFCLIFGWFSLLADEYKQLGKHIAGGAGFISNFIFSNEIGYFDNSADTKPLLHLWSLGIEEQFYVVWPPLLWLAWKRKFNLFTIIVIIAVISFTLNVIGTKQDAAASFYSPQTRFWELLSGSLLAWIKLYKKNALANIENNISNYMSTFLHNEKQETAGNLLSNALSFFGFALFAVGFLLINKNLSFPGMWALIPVIGTLLILMSGSKAWLSRKILSNKIAVWFGLISFPLYLWHWPLLSFATIVESEIPSLNIRIAALILSIVFAWLTYKLIENPIRFGKFASRNAKVLILLMSIVGYFGYSVFKNDGLIFNRAIDKQSKNINAIHAEKEARDNCNLAFPNWLKMTDNPCRMQKSTGNTIAIIGDSHAGHLYAGMSELVTSNAGIANFSASCAAPYINISSGASDPGVHKVRANAYRLINSAYDYIIQDQNIRTVILAHMPECSFGDVKDMADLNNKNEESILRNGMIRTFDSLLRANKNILVLFDNPHLPFDPSICINRPLRITNNKNKCFFSRSQFDSNQAFSRYKSIVNSVIKDYPKILTYDLSATLCDEKNCYLAKNGKILYGDRGHLTIEGSRYVAPDIMKAINNHN